MDAHGLPIVGTGLDYQRVESLSHRQTLVMLNKFVIHTAKFLNRFSSICEERLLDISLRIQRLDISLNILEAKLNSIATLDNIQATTQYNPPEVLAGAGNAPPPPQPVQSQPSQAAAPSAGPAPPPPPSGGEPIPPPQPGPGEDAAGGGGGGGGGMKIKDHPDYQRFFKMKRLGVNPLQIGMEMKRYGLNPDLLEDEDAPAPGGGAGGGAKATSKDTDDESSMSGSSDEESEEEDSDSFGSD